MKNLRLVCRLPNGDERKVLVAAADFQSVRSVATEKLGTDSLLIRIKVDDGDGGGGGGGDLWEVDQSFWPSLQSGQTLFADCEAALKKRQRRRPSKAAGNDSSTSAGEDSNAEGQRAVRRRSSASSTVSATRASGSRQKKAARREPQQQEPTTPRSSRQRATATRPQSSPHNGPSPAASAHGASNAIVPTTSFASVSITGIPAPPAAASSRTAATGGDDGWDKLMAPIPRSSGKVWSPRDDAFLWNHFKNSLKTLDRKPSTSPERYQFFQKLLADHGTDGRIDTTLAGRTVKSLEARIRTKIRTAIAKDETVPSPILEFFGMLRTSPARSGREESRDGYRSGDAGGERESNGRSGRTYVVVDDETCDEGDEDDTSSDDQGTDVTPPRPGISGATRTAASSVPPAQYAGGRTTTSQPLTRAQSRPRRVQRSQTAMSGSAPAVHAEPVFAGPDQNARRLQERQAAMNPFNPNTRPLGSSEASTIEAHQPASTVPLVEAVIKTEAPSGSGLGNLGGPAGKPPTSPNAAPMRLELQPQHLLENDRGSAFAVAPGAHWAEVRLLRMALSSRWGRVRQRVRDIVARHTPHRLVELDQVKWLPAASDIYRVVMAEFGSLDQRGEATPARYTEICSAVVLSMIKAVFEIVAPPSWSVRRVSFTLAGYFAALALTHKGATHAERKRLFLQTAERTCWALRAAAVGQGRDLNQEESEDICAALIMTLGSNGTFDALIEERTSVQENADPIVLESTVARLNSLLIKLEASILFLQRCRLPVERLGAASFLRHTTSSILHPDRLQAVVSQAGGPNAGPDWQERTFGWLQGYRTVYNRLVQDGKIVLCPTVHRVF
ncbi:unnamed protein product [Parajaminaea phylloscopi]